MLRELEEAVQRNFHEAAVGADTTRVACDWQARLHISQVCESCGHYLPIIIYNQERSSQPFVT